jgi:hypothetical protein
MSKLIDPPSGWRFGFPKEIPEEILNSTFEEILEWLVINGYPKDEIEKYREQNGEYTYFHYRIIDNENHNKLKSNRKELFFGTEKRKKSRKLNLDAVRESQTMVTIGFKCKPEIKLILAEKAIKSHTSLSNYISQIIENLQTETIQTKNEDAKLKSLAEFNAEKLKSNFDLTDLQKPKKNGIACPACAEELFDSKPMETLLSFPAQKNVHCEKCNYIGLRIA